MNNDSQTSFDFRHHKLHTPSKSGNASSSSSIIVAEDVFSLSNVCFQFYLETFYLILFFLISRHSPRFRNVMGVPMVPESWVLHFFFSSSRLHCLC